MGDRPGPTQRPKGVKNELLVSMMLGSAVMPGEQAQNSTRRPEERVRQSIIQQLRALGWAEDRLRWRPEWPIPATPHDLTKRERGQQYAVAGTCDLVAFADNSQEPHALQVIFEFKAPEISAGRDQLMRYLSGEPAVKMGYWTNGSESLAIYKRHAAEWLQITNAPLPAPGDDLTQPPDEPPTWNALREPTEVELTVALRRLLATVVVQDSRATRREDQLREVVHVLLVKLESDAVARRSTNNDKPVSFRLYGNQNTKVHETAQAVRTHFSDYFKRQRTRIFHPDDRNAILLTDETIFAIVAELAGFRILGDDIEVLSKAFQVFRASALKSGEGQFLTPQRVVRPCVMALEITSQDKVIDPACGTGGFLLEALRQVRERDFPNADEDWDLIKWANDNLYGVDLDHIGVKLTRAIMIALRDGSSHVLLGDSVRRHQWRSKFPKLSQELGLGGIEEAAHAVADQFTVVVTNPPFGEDLKLSASDARASQYTIARAAAAVTSKPVEYVNLEIGLIFLELAHKLVRVGGRIGIVLPETYFFSHRYRWLPGWLDGRLALRGMLNIPMEAFEEFCRAKTNFYIFEKVGDPVLADQQEEN